MCKYVHSRICRSFFRQRERKLGIYDRHIGTQGIIGQGVLNVPALSVCDHRKGCHLAPGTGRGGNGYKLSLCSQLREFHHALADIHEFLLQSVKSGIGMFIEQPHTLGGVYGRSSPNGNDHVGVKITHFYYAAFNGFHIGIGLYIGVDFGVTILIAFAQVIKDFIYITQFDHGRVCHNERPGYIFHFFKVLNRVVFKIDFRGDLKPLHIHSSFCDFLFVYKIDRRYVGRSAVVSVRTAT